jgi:hypothetical protein
MDQAVSLDRNYWLAHSEGYRVTCPGGRVGTVVGADLDEAGREVTALRVGCGILRRRIVRVEVDGVSQIVPHALLVRLRARPDEPGAGAIARRAKGRVTLAVSR